MKFLLTAHLPDDYTPTEEDVQNAGAIHALNAEIEAAGGMVFACGLMPAPYAKTVSVDPAGSAIITDGPYLETKEHIGGFLIVEASTWDQVLEWARKGSAVGRRPIEVREIFFQEE